MAGHASPLRWWNVSTDLYHGIRFSNPGSGAQIQMRLCGINAVAGTPIAPARWISAVWMPTTPSSDAISAAASSKSSFCVARAKCLIGSPVREERIP